VASLVPPSSPRPGLWPSLRALTSRERGALVPALLALCSQAVP
jgi:hypothetical protein